MSSGVRFTRWRCESIRARLRAPSDHCVTVPVKPSRRSDSAVSARKAEQISSRQWANRPARPAAAVDQVAAMRAMQTRRARSATPLRPGSDIVGVMQTRFTQAYGLSTPIAQAGMAFVGMTPELAVAVSNAGALGSLGVGLTPAPVLTQLIAGIRAGTSGPFNINFITIFTEQAQIDAACEAAVPVASFHWGHPPRAWIDQLHTAGVRVFEQVGSVDDGRRAVDDGVDVVVAQGLEAGGHNYASLPTFALVPLVVDAVAPALVLAAGGIADGRGLAAALMLGADGAWIGTRLVATDESGAHDGYKAALVEAGATETVRTSLFGPETPEFNPMRVLRNRAIDEPPTEERPV